MFGLQGALVLNSDQMHSSQWQKRDSWEEVTAISLYSIKYEITQLAEDTDARVFLFSFFFYHDVHLGITFQELTLLPPTFSP
jgi:hypothetical protein